MATTLSLRAVADECGVTATTIARRLKGAGAEVGARVLGRDGKTYASRPYSAPERAERANECTGYGARDTRAVRSEGTPVSLGAIVRDRRMVACPSCDGQRLGPSVPPGVHV